MAERWHPQPVMHTPDDDRCFVAEHRRAFRHIREACFQLLKRLQREGPDPYAVVIPVESKFGLTFDIIDRERVGELRRQRGFSVNPWTTGSRFLLAHSLLTDEVYVPGCAISWGNSAPAPCSFWTKPTMPRPREERATPFPASSRDP